MASFGVNPVSPEASKSWFLRKICPSSTGSKSTSHNHCAEVLVALGYSANTVSLLALVLAIGIVVDDAIVVVENVERVMEEEPELSPADATKKAMTQITAPIIAITLVLLSVFVPIAFIPGISGTLFRQFAVTVSVAMLLSAINALTLSPALCAVFLR